MKKKPSNFQKSSGNFTKRSSREKKQIIPDAIDIRLNRYIANTGVCSRREADELIKDGKIKVNNKIVTELGTKVSLYDKVKYNGKILNPERHVYYLLNKPKDYITTTKDPQKRKTVMHLMSKVSKERIYPVGRLDRQTTGLLLFTNDGVLAKQLMHPSTEVKKIYQVILNKDLKIEDLEKVEQGIKLEDGIAHVDSIHYETGKEQNVLVLTLHSGKNRIIRRIFGSMHYKVDKLDRVYFAGLTKKDLPRGRSRPLTKVEIGMLHMIKNKKGPAK